MNERVFIRTQYGCVIIERTHNTEDGSIICERATNMAELASEALSAVVAQGGIRWIDGEWECPPELAARASWPTLLEQARAAA